MGYDYEKDLEETIPEFTGYFIPTHLTHLDVKRIAFILKDCKTKNIVVLDNEQIPALENESVRRTLLKVLKKKGYEAIDSTGQFPEYRASVSVRIR